MNSKKAIIVPGITDLNKGDQALVWESYRLVKDTLSYDKICLLTNGDTMEEREALCSQSMAQGFSFIENILKHPRRGRHVTGEHIKESRASFFRQVFNATVDFIQSAFILLICNQISLVKFFCGSITYETIRAFKESDTVFVKGGGFIHAYGEKTAPYLMWYFLFYIRLAKRLGKKVVVFPNSFGPFDGLTVKKQVRAVLGKVELIYARERVSSLKLGNLLGRDIPVEMDLGFFLQTRDQVDVRKLLLEKYAFGEKDKIVGITIRPWRFPGMQNPEGLYNNYLESIEKLIRYIISLEFKVALCNQSLGPSTHEDDRNAIRYLLRRLEGQPTVTWIDENLNCVDLKALYSHFYLFVGTRFHSIIFSMTSLVPSIAIGYGGNKAKGIMGDFNLDEYVVPIEEVNGELLIEKFNSAVLEYEQIKDSLRVSTLKINESRSRIIEDIKGLH